MISNFLSLFLTYLPVHPYSIVLLIWSHFYGLLVNYLLKKVYNFLLGQTASINTSRQSS